ncbi:methyl-accepting chemotaxis sensory transducer [Hylemonella gracilis ATCC 19624]|uniref:Methyl-accepting chemotaxis sensory transducer n=1 Tax=Hylemonella gracilis ATCC 19624 TaxID=887062 RepID=F3KV38_9BURK|nr:methyl-accepting chemotaxis sensory transducer [Hylemonella gracilis ATCC 19624]
MDQTTQQNAALVEEMATAASNLKTQAKELVDLVAVFQVEGQEVLAGALSASDVASAPVRRSGPAALEMAVAA